MKKPSTRKERVQWLAKKFGNESIIVWAEKTDREVRHEFEKLYALYKEKPDFESSDDQKEASKCIICNSEVIWWSKCGCGENLAVFSEDDPDYEERLKELEDQ